MDDLEEALEEFHRQVLRLKTCREAKARLQELRLEGEDILDSVEVQSDLGSAASTQSNQSSSGRSSKTGKSGRSRRKAERKRHLGKEGSVHEADYLVEALTKRLSSVKLLEGTLLGCATVSLAMLTIV